MSRLFEDEDPATIGAIIRAAFQKRGGNIPIHDLAAALIAEKVLPAGVVERAALRGITETCRRALSVISTEGVPYAQPLGTGRKARWKQLDLYTHADFSQLIAQRVRNLEEDFEMTRRLQICCLERFGSAPEIPELIMPVSVDDADAADEAVDEFDGTA